MAIAFISHSDCRLHDMGSFHPESPLRLDAIWQQLVNDQIEPLLELLDAPLASREQLALAHSPEYIESVYRTAPVHGTVELDPDTTMNPHTLTAALRAAGAAVLGVDRVMSGQNQAAFCCVRPPSHHAERNRAMGFCIFNNVAIGALYALHTHSLKRVAIVDFDVHYGNGTENIIHGTPAAMLCSSFEHPFYPGSGVGPLPKHIIKVPLPAGTGRQPFRQAVESRILPALESFRPEMILFSAGFDGHKEDPLAGFNLTEEDYHWITTRVRHIADKFAQGRIVSTMEGGYALQALGRSVSAHLQALL